MARARSPEKRSAILQAAVHEIAVAGLGAPTSKIARGAGVAEGTLFTYFASKDELLNELYFELKSEAYRAVNSSFPHKASLEKRAWHVWSSYLNWAIEFPEKRKVSVQLSVSDLITEEARARTFGDRAMIEKTLSELKNRGALRAMPDGFAAVTMAAMQEAAMEFIAKHPRQRKSLIESAFQVFWRAVH